MLTPATSKLVKPLGYSMTAQWRTSNRVSKLDTYSPKSGATKSACSSVLGHILETLASLTSRAHCGFGNCVEVFKGLGEGI